MWETFVRLRARCLNFCELNAPIERQQWATRGKAESSVSDSNIHTGESKYLHLLVVQGKNEEEGTDWKIFRLEGKQSPKEEAKWEVVVLEMGAVNKEKTRVEKSLGQQGELLDSLLVFW